MAIRLRNSEKKDILDLLEAEYPTPLAAAAEVLRSMATILAERESLAVVLSQDGILLMWGPFYDRAAATRAASIDRDCRIVPLRSPSALLRRLADPPDDRYCPVCGHPRVAHVDRRWRPTGAKRLMPPGCMVKGCSCDLQW